MTVITGWLAPKSVPLNRTPFALNLMFPRVLDLGLGLFSYYTLSLAVSTSPE